MKKLDLPTQLVAIISTVILLVLIAVSLTVLNPPQCDEQYTQVQGVDTSDCIVGANISLGLLNLFIIVPWLIFTVLVWVRFVQVRKKPLPQPLPKEVEKKKTPQKTKKPVKKSTKKSQEK